MVTLNSIVNLNKKIPFNGYRIACPRSAESTCQNAITTAQRYFIRSYPALTYIRSDKNCRVRNAKRIVCIACVIGRRCSHGLAKESGHGVGCTPRSRLNVHGPSRDRRSIVMGCACAKPHVTIHGNKYYVHDQIGQG